ncbi:MAG: FKBP-type peptidyl-prolyl cis-trans isomerase [Bacteroidales bacterium]
MRNLWLIIFPMLLFSCRPPVQEEHEVEPDTVGEQFVRANQYMQRRHQDHIAAFVERVGWKARTTPSGLWIVVNTPGEGTSIDKGDRVTYTYESTLLDGTPCYRAGADDPKSIIVGQGGVESGVEEGLQLMRQGTEATLLIPPHLGHGNFGDRDRIPGNSVLIYHLKVIGVQKG